MLKKYKVKNYPIIEEVIAIESLSTVLGPEGFLVIKVKSDNPDEIAAYIDEAGWILENLGIKHRCIFVTNDVTIAEVVDLENKMIEEERR